VKGYNGTMYSDPSVVDLKEGQQLAVTLSFPGLPENQVVAYPCPAKTNEVITFQFKTGYVNPIPSVLIYSISGELVKEIKNELVSWISADSYNCIWDCKNNNGDTVASGVYIYVIKVEEPGTGKTDKVIKKLAIIH
jgi:hypothetical protein